MPRTIDDGFDDFLKKLTPSGLETQAAADHRQSLEVCLKNHFTVSRFFRTGSFGNGTSISGYSDVDYFVSIKRQELKKHSSSTLREIREYFEKRYPQTLVKVDSPSVVLFFGDGEWERTEITPADYIDGDSGKRIYEIPDTQDGWMVSSPDRHNAYVDSWNKYFDLKLKALIRFVKAWKYYRKVPISSFYLEIFTTRWATSEKVIVYPYDVKNVLKALWENQLSAMQDPIGISGYIKPCRSDAEKVEALSKLETAKTRAENAVSCQIAKNDLNAFYWWGLLFDGEFPTYYY